MPKISERMRDLVSSFASSLERHDYRMSEILQTRFALQKAIAELEAENAALKTGTVKACGHCMNSGRVCGHGIPAQYCEAGCIAAGMSALCDKCQQ